MLSGTIFLGFRLLGPAYYTNTPHTHSCGLWWPWWSRQWWSHTYWDHPGIDGHLRL